MTSTEEIFEKAGGPAFPSVAEGGADSGFHPEFNPGMTLRDYFAARAPSVPQYYGREDRPDEADTCYQTKVLAWEAARRARWNYIYADAMLVERSK